MHPASCFESTRAPSPLRRETILSTCSADSCTNLNGQGDFVQGSSRGYLPTFHSSSHGISTQNSSNIRRYFKTAFHGWRIAMGSWLNVFLILIPISWAMTITLKASHGLTFSLCILALIPLVRLHDLSTRELATRIGGSKTGLLNGSMSNFVEIVVAISALRKCELKVVQSTLIGSMLSKLLLVLGLCFFAGGVRFSEQGFDATATQVHSSLLSLSVGALLLPAAYHFTLGNGASDTSESQTSAILHMSHAVSIVLLLIYIAYLLFQLWSHTHLYNDEHNKKSNKHSTTMRQQRLHGKSSQSSLSKRPPSQAEISLEELPVFAQRRSYTASSSGLSEQTIYNNSERPFNKEIRRPPSISVIHLGGNDGLGGYPMSRESSFNSSGFSSASTSFVPLEPESEQKLPSPPNSPGFEVKKKVPQMSWFLTLFLLIIVTGAVAVTVDWLVEAMDEISTTIRKEWVGLILLPAISSVAECITAVKVSVKDELTLSVSVAVGSAIQTALLVIPFTVILGWITNKPLSLLMDPFQSMVLYIAVHTMGYVVADGKSNWLEGVILVCLYVIIAVSFWFYPGVDIPLAVCVSSS
ncbi:hypothetical protein BDN70DRAFT_871602 [Pholiota conissans]|uniref:Sodium/calcium exchanger membrane region domain-containing protein n=1 Tax=Pholiota conissans TaxID=109636 RepID=A0A9P5ZEH8_9AGAR|nr:hypothetical protein BDN70DRAFT_871602 [Pholiota conissans]